MSKITEKTFRYKDGKKLFKVVMKTYICPCGYKNIGYPNDEKCSECKKSLKH